jgi:predicted transcriptional regulator
MAKVGNDDKKGPQPLGKAALEGTFHRVSSLIPEDKELLTIEPDMKVADAIKLMQLHHYSQLPVQVENAVLDVFSYRSFSEKILSRHKGELEKRANSTPNKKVEPEKWIGDLKVEDFLEEYEFVPATQDWNRILDLLNRDDAFFVGHRDGLEGLVTTMDVLNFFRHIANSFIMLAEIELSLRHVIVACIDADSWQSALESSLTSKYKDRAVPMSLDEMTFNDYVQIIVNSDNWQFFKHLFGEDSDARGETNQKLQQLRIWRNDVFHFKRSLDNDELKTLGEYRKWLDRRVRAFSARRAKKETKAKTKKPGSGKTTKQALLDACEPVAAEFFDWLMSYAISKGCAIEFGEKGFSVRKKNGRKRISFAYGYPKDTFLLYMEKIPSELGVRWREQFVATGILEEKGSYTLESNVNSNNVEQLRDVFKKALEQMMQAII